MKILRLMIISLGLASLLAATLMVINPPARVQALPPRPAPKETKTQIKGGFIALTVENAVDEVWTVVQWQDPNTGDWYLVDGWQGSTNATYEVRWYVAKANLGEGPFRWLVYDDPDSNLLAISDTFYLPEQAGETVSVSVVLP